MPKRYWLEIYGCQMNFAEGYALENELRQLGWEAADTAENADVAILHTCSVRQTAENRIWGRIGFFKHIKQSRPQKLVVMGCMAERLKNEITAREPAVDLVVGNYAKTGLAETLDKCSEGIPPLEDPLQEKPFEFQKEHVRGREFHAYVPIMHGCNNFCTYCIVPYVRGREISRSPEDILSEVRGLSERGVKEISLLGQNVNSYSYQSETGILQFPDILSRVLEASGSIEWLRFITSHPKDVHPELIELMASEPKLCEHIHLPVQHGSSSVLKRMNRKYTREDYEALVAKMRAKIPQIALTTDILIGFPGESEEDFQETLQLMRELRFDDAFMYFFNPREGTPAAKFPDQLPDQLKHERLAEVIELQRAISHEKRGERLGSRERVLVESVSKKNEGELLGRSERDQMVVFQGGKDLVGSFVTVKLEALHGNTFKGKMEKNDR